MKYLLAAFLVMFAAAAPADTSCTLTPAQGQEPTTLLIRGEDAGDEAIILVGDRTLILDCPRFATLNALECYGNTKPPIEAPAQLNVTTSPIGPGAVVVLSIRNQFFGKNKHIGYHRRHASIHVFTVDRCDRF